MEVVLEFLGVLLVELIDVLGMTHVVMVNVAVEVLRRLRCHLHGFEL